MKKNSVILIVEDNEDDAELTERALKKNNIANEIVRATDGVEALDYLYARGAHAGRNKAELPQMVLLDLNMPRVGGIEVLRTMKADPALCSVPVVVLTTSDEERDIVESYRLGANSYIKKPVDYAQFTESVRQLGLYWMVLNIPPVSG